MEPEDIEQLRAQLRGPFKTYGVTRAAIFGSVARGDQGPESDVDLLVEFEEGRSLFDLVLLKEELATILGREADITTFKGLHPIIREKVMREQVPLL